MVAGLIYLDNYDEVLESVEEVRRSLLLALIDRKISKYVANLDGITKKLEKDKYFVVLKYKSLEELEANRFSLLEEVKTVNIGNEMKVTLSIGIGVNGSTYAQNYEFSRIAIELALGRGGDQAVVKDNDKISLLRRQIPADGKEHACKSKSKGTCTSRIYRKPRRCGHHGTQDHGYRFFRSSRRRMACGKDS